jgi:radical SAM-linked protein
MKVRLRFSKLGKIRFTSHRDVARIWERALRRAALPVAYTEGFSPRPKLHFGLALSTGHESLAEYLDVDLRDEVEIAALPALLDAELPVGIRVTAAAPVAPGTPSLQEAVASCSWRIEALGLDPALADSLVADLLAADEVLITRTRKGKEVTDDLRPAILTVSLTGPTTGGVSLDADLAVHPRSARPSELLRALASQAPPARRAAVTEGNVLRVAQWTWRDGVRCEPLAAPDVTARGEDAHHGRDHTDPGAVREREGAAARG